MCFVPRPQPSWAAKESFRGFGEINREIPASGFCPRSRVMVGAANSALLSVMLSSTFEVADHNAARAEQRQLHQQKREFAHSRYMSSQSSARSGASATTVSGKRMLSLAGINGTDDRLALP